MAAGDRRQFWSGFWLNSLGTLASRVLGLARDMATAALLGLGESGIMDAFVVAFRLPNLARRIFGEGALATSFLPVFHAQMERQPRRAWLLLGTLFTLLAVTLSALTLAGEALCALVLFYGDSSPRTRALVGLSAALLPYMPLVCLAALASAALQGLFRFRTAALAPLLLNICWLAAAWFVAPCFTDKLAQAYVLAGAILVSGVLQLLVQLPELVGHGFRFRLDWHAAREPVREVGRAMLPITLGMTITQLNTLLDSLIAWGLAAPPGSSRAIAWLGGAVSYPLETGAAAAIYYGERFYQLPVGILGIAIATVMYPRFSRHAARGDGAQIAADLNLGLRLVAFTALPASAGMMLVARPITRVLFERGEFTSADAERAAAMIACYAAGVWAYCAIPVLVRAFYAIGDRMTPARVGLRAVGVNLVLNFSLIWPLAERGLAISTAIAAAVQVLLLTAILAHAISGWHWQSLFASLGRSLLATSLMSAAVAIAQQQLSSAAAASRVQQMLELTILIGIGTATYLAAARLMHMDELSLLLRRPRADE